MQNFKRVICVILLILLVLPFSSTDLSAVAAPSSGASLHMNGGAGFIFNLVFDTTAGANIGEQTIVIPGNSTVAAVYQNGTAMALHDQLIYVLVTDSNNTPVGTILPNAIGSRSSTAVLQADGSMGANGQMVGNSGTINFWFNGFPTDGNTPPGEPPPPPQPSASYIMADKVWLNADGSRFTGATPPLNFQLTGTSASGPTNVPILPGVPVIVQDGTYTITEPDITGFSLISIDSGTMQTNLPGREASISPTANSNYSATFINMVDVNSSDFILQGVKTGNDDFGAGIFNFIVTDSAGNVVSTGINTAGSASTPGSIAFTPITYTSADVGKTFIYTIREVSSTDPAWTIDTRTVTVEVTVSLVGSTIVATQSPDSASVMFDNTFTVGSVSFTPLATKQISGVNTPLEAGKYSFVVREQPSGTIVSTGTNVAGTNVAGVASGAITFTDITYTFDGGSYPRTYNYTVEETTPAGNGWNLIPATRTISVNVAYDGSVLSITPPTPTYSPASILFENYYTSRGFLFLNAHKTTSGGALAAGQFRFEITDEFNNQVAAGVNDANGNIPFASISYTNIIPGSVGFHLYTITETTLSGGGWTTSSVSYPVLVRVSDNGNGTMNVTPFNLNTDNLVFVNTYGSSGSVVLNATKLANGGTLTNGQFQFAVQNESGVTVATGTNNAAGNITFSPIQYTNNDIGVHHYTIFETSPIITVPGPGGFDVGMWTPSPLTYHVSVSVVDNGDGTITATPVYPRMGLNFINTYTNFADPVGSIALNATKSTAGAPMTGGEFSFAVVETVGGNDIVVATGTNDSNGKIQFSAIPYTVNDIGTHSYKVIETTPVAPYWQTDSSVFNVSVDVMLGTYPSPDGGTTPGAPALICISAYPLGGMYFTNNYAPPDRMLSITKTITGFQGFNVFDPNSISPITFLVVGTNTAGAEIYRQTVAFNSTNFQWNPNLKNYTAILHSLPAGNYTVYERGGFAPGYVNNRPNPPQSATVTDTVPASVAFTNAYTLAPVPPANHPAFTVNKVFHGIRNAEIPAGFRIQITGPGGFNSTVNLNDAMSGNGGLFTNLAPGTYYINEQNNVVPGFVNRVSVNGQRVTLPYAFQITQDTGHITITIDNNYVRSEQSPQTGVSRSVAIPVMLLSFGAICFAGAAIIHRRYRTAKGN